MYSDWLSKKNTALLLQKAQPQFMVTLWIPFGLEAIKTPYFFILLCQYHGWLLFGHGCKLRTNYDQIMFTHHTCSNFVRISRSWGVVGFNFVDMGVNFLNINTIGIYLSNNLVLPLPFCIQCAWPEWFDGTESWLAISTWTGRRFLCKVGNILRKRCPKHEAGLAGRTELHALPCPCKLRHQPVVAAEIFRRLVDLCFGDPALCNASAHCGCNLYLASFLQLPRDWNGFKVGWPKCKWYPTP